MKKRYLILLVLPLAWWALERSPSVDAGMSVEGGGECAARPARAADSGQAPKIKGRTPMEAAEKYLEGTNVRVSDHHELRPRVYRTPLGTEVSYEVFQDGVPIVGLGIRLRMNRSMEIEEVVDEYRPLPKADTTPRLSVSEVAEQAVVRYEFDSTEESRAQAGKVLFARRPDESPELAWVIPMQCGKIPCQVMLRASDGQLLARHLSRTEF